MDDKKVLIAFDGSGNAFKAVDYAAALFSGLKDVTFTLFYVIPNVPPQFWDDGHILTPEEKSERQQVINRWFANQKTVIEPQFQKAGQVFSAKGFSAGQVNTKVISEIASVADALVEEAKDGGHRTVILGGRGSGALAAAILHRTGGLAICVVD